MSADPVHEMLLRLRRQGVKLSRNRNYDLFEGHVERRALKLHRMLRQLEHELLAYARHEGAEVRLAAVRGQRSAIEVRIPPLRLRRTIYLGARELALLKESPELAGLLRGGAPPGDVVECEQGGG